MSFVTKLAMIYHVCVAKYYCKLKAWEDERGECLSLIYMRMQLYKSDDHAKNCQKREQIC